MTLAQHQAIQPGGTEANPDLLGSLAQTVISTSIGIKHQVTSREAHLERMGIALDLLLR